MRTFSPTPLPLDCIQKVASVAFLWPFSSRYCGRIYYRMAGKNWQDAGITEEFICL